MRYFIAFRHVFRHAQHDVIGRATINLSMNQGVFTISMQAMIRFSGHRVLGFVEINPTIQTNDELAIPI